MDAVPYAGLPGNGYSLIVGPDHRVRKIIGYDEFPERFMFDVPCDRRETLMNEVAVRFGDEAVVEFILDTVGLLPFDKGAGPELACCVQEWDSWKYERRLMQPVPVSLKSTCHLIRVTPTSSEIEIEGRISSGQTYITKHVKSAGSVRINGGSTSGTCVVDRRTGVPKEVHCQEVLNIEIDTPGGILVSQEKQLTSTIRLFPTGTRPGCQYAKKTARSGSCFRRFIPKRPTCSNNPTTVR